MKSIILLLLFAGLCVPVFATEEAGHAPTREHSRSIFSVHAGLAGDGNEGLGVGGIIQSSSFMGGGPFYYGFSSIFGSFLTIDESFFESGVHLGYNKPLGKSGFDLDLFLNFLLFGGRVHTDTMAYQGEAPALNVGAILGFSVLPNIDAAISLSPVLRPFDRENQVWDFSRSYIMLALSFRSKSYSLVERHSWSEFPYDASKGVE